MHGYHETLINCGASPPGSRLLCILRAGSRKTTWLSVLANFKMIYRPRETKFFAVLRGFSAAPRGNGRRFRHATAVAVGTIRKVDVADRLLFYILTI